MGACSGTKIQSVSFNNEISQHIYSSPLAITYVVHVYGKWLVVSSKWSLGPFYTCDLRIVKKFDLGLLILMAKTKGNPKSFSKSLGHMATYKADLDWDPHSLTKFKFNILKFFIYSL